VPFHIVGTPPSDAEWNVEGHPVVPVDAGAVAELARRAQRYLVF
jgi:hypothetical protein